LTIYNFITTWCIEINAGFVHVADLTQSEPVFMYEPSQVAVELVRSVYGIDREVSTSCRDTPQAEVVSWHEISKPA